MNSIPVSTKMTHPLIFLRSDSSLEEAARLMEQHLIRHLPVRGESGAFEGMIAESDLQLARDPVTKEFRPGESIAPYVSRPLVSVDEKTPLADAAETMLEEKVSALLVTRNGEAAGIVTSGDMLSLLRELLLHGENGKLAKVDLTYEPVWREAAREAAAVGL